MCGNKALLKIHIVTFQILESFDFCFRTLTERDLNLVNLTLKLFLT